MQVSLHSCETSSCGPHEILAPVSLVASTRNALYLSKASTATAAASASTSNDPTAMGFCIDVFSLSLLHTFLWLKPSRIAFFTFSLSLSLFTPFCCCFFFCIDPLVDTGRSHCLTFSPLRAHTHFFSRYLVWKQFLLLLLLLFVHRSGHDMIPSDAIFYEYQSSSSNSRDRSNLKQAPRGKAHLIYLQVLSSSSYCIRCIARTKSWVTSTQ